MKKIILRVLFAILVCLISVGKVQAVQFDVLVLPTNIFSVCDNYFCFQEVPEIVADDVIKNLNSYKNINAVDLTTVRNKLTQNSELKGLTQNMLNKFEETEKIDFNALHYIAKEFGVKSVVLISCYAITDRSDVKRDLWEVLEISSAFKISYPFSLVTTAVLTDSVNNVVMWSSKYNKNVSDTNGYFMAQNQAQATSHLEKIKQYSKNNVSQNISQNIHLRFFPKDVRTFDVKNSTDTNGQENEVRFVPNALDHLIQPQMIKEIEDGHFNTVNPSDDFIFEF